MQLRLFSGSLPVKIARGGVGVLRVTKKFDELNEDARIVANIYRFLLMQQRVLTEYFDWTSADVEEGNGCQYSSTSYASLTLNDMSSSFQGCRLELSFDDVTSGYNGPKTRFVFVSSPRRYDPFFIATLTCNYLLLRLLRCPKLKRTKPECRDHLFKEVLVWCALKYDCRIHNETNCISGWRKKTKLWCNLAKLKAV